MSTMTDLQALLKSKLLPELNNDVGYNEPEKSGAASEDLILKKIRSEYSSLICPILDGNNEINSIPSEQIEKLEYRLKQPDYFVCIGSDEELYIGFRLKQLQHRRTHRNISLNDV